MEPVKQRFDIYRQSYDRHTNRISSRLISGGYTNWSDAIIAETVLKQLGKVVSLSIKPCMHTDNESSAERHQAKMKFEELKELLDGFKTK